LVSAEKRQREGREKEEKVRVTPTKGKEEARRRNRKFNEPRQVLIFAKHGFNISFYNIIEFVIFPAFIVHEICQ
jgi:hypothetical protein